MQREHICESWHANRGKLPADYLLSARVFLQKLQLQQTELSETYSEYSLQNTKNNFRLIGGKIAEFLFIKLTLYLTLSFRNLS